MQRDILAFSLIRRTEKCDPADRKRWPDQHEWLFRELQNFHKVFAARIKQLNVEDFDIDK